MDVAAPINIFDAIQTLGVVGVLTVMLGAFLRGIIWPDGHVKEALKAQQDAAEKTAEIMVNGIREGIEAAIERGIERGIVGGITESRKQNGE